MTQETKKDIEKSHLVDAENLEVDYGFRITHYKMDENGNYVHQLQNEWGGREPVVHQSWEIIKEKIQNAKEKVISGEISPIAYYMEKCISDIKTLALYIGIAPWRVKRHLKVKVFNKLNDEMLKKYAGFFEITVEELKDIEHLKTKTEKPI